MSNTSPRHFLDLNTTSPDELRRILNMATAMKSERKHFGRDVQRPLSGKTIALIFEKASTRTRVSFEVGMKQLGGEVVILDSSTTQLGRGETVADTARVLSRYVDIIMIRTDDHAKLEELAKYASVPVINGLTDYTHPCQIMADIQTFEEHLGDIKGHKIAWVGDGNNVGISWIHAAVQFGFELHMAVPEGLEPEQSALDWASKQGCKIHLTRDPIAAAKDASAVVTDVWVSMGDDAASMQRHNMLRPFQVDQSVMDAAKANAVFMHCLPAHRGEEVTADVIDGPRSVVFDEAENRLHAQKAILAWCLEEA